VAYPIGIDLGTSNSVACVWKRGQPQCIPVEGGGAILPSALSVTPDGNVLVGSAAKKRAIIEPAGSVLSAKRFMGDGKTTWTIHGKTYTPIQVSALILQRLKEAAVNYLRQPVTEAVITVPAYFDNNQKRDTKLAGEAAGLKVLQLLQEPTAAAISYGQDKGRDQTLMVYDLGGGTFDVSILKVKGNKYDVVAVGGNSHLGGDDFDLQVAELLVSRLKRKPPKDTLDAVLTVLRHKAGEEDIQTTPEIRQACQRLKEKAEAAKLELSESNIAHVELPDVLGTQLDTELTLKDYNALIGPPVQQTIKCVNDTLASARLRASQIDRVILVGGSTRNRLVKQEVTKAVKEPWTSEWVDEAVARGAAIVAAAGSPPEEDSRPIEITFSDVTPFDLGVRASKGSDLDLFEVLIRKNTPIGSSQSNRQFTTRKTNQKTVEIAVFQGNGSHCRENTFIGKFVLTGIPPAPAGEPKVVVELTMDRSDLLSVTATCSTLRSEQKLDVNMVSKEDDRPATAAQADIMFLVDTSGSMSAELVGVKKSGLEFAEKVTNAGVSCRLGVVDFDKPVFRDTYRWEVFGPMPPEQCMGAIKDLKIGRLGGCGCYVGDAGTVPVIEAFAKTFTDNNRLKIGILVSDEVGKDPASIASIVRILQDANVCMHVFGVPGSCHETIAEATGGKFWDIIASRGHVNFSELLDGVAAEITNLALL